MVQQEIQLRLLESMVTNFISWAGELTICATGRKIMLWVQRKVVNDLKRGT